MNNLLESIVFLCLMTSGQVILPFSYGKEIPTSRNNLAETSSPAMSQSTSTSSSTYDCLYLSPDLPPCDFERVQDSEEEATYSTVDYEKTKEANDYLERHQSIRPSRSIGDSERRHVIVYTIAGCLPHRLPFSMPLCRVENSFDKIIDVRKIYPFVVPGLTKPPLVFPEFNFDRWLRMMRRLRNRLSTTTNAEKSRDIASKGIPNGILNRQEDPSIDVTKTPTKASIASIRVLKGSSKKDFIVHNRQKEPTGGKQEEIEVRLPKTLKRTEKPVNEILRDSVKNPSLKIEATNDPYRSSDYSQQSKTVEENEEIAREENTPQVLREGAQRETFDDVELEAHSKKEEEEEPEIPIAPILAREIESETIESNDNLYRSPVVLDVSSNDLRKVDSDGFKNLAIEARERNLDFNENNEIARETIDFANKHEIFGENLRRRREIRLAEELARETSRREFKLRGKSRVPRAQRLRGSETMEGNVFDHFEKSDGYRKSKSLTDEHGTAMNHREEDFGRKSSRETEKVENRVMKSRNDFSKRNRDSRDKTVTLNRSKVSKGSISGAGMRKKYGSNSKRNSKYGRRSRRL